MSYNLLARDVEGEVVDEQDTVDFWGQTGKSSWPELVGTRGEEAVAIIIKENPSVRAHTIYLYTMYPPSFCALTQDLRFNRILIFIDQRCLVALPPKIG
ncbi:hypothetical protein ACFX2I_012543 [Malus domestica]|uniref:inhibitor of trypsin and hageman factor-like n=1 Tax=Malus sylvestris TaxID=3752 RepID=UPI0021AC85F1|nr:inhibitor of trypsin and hageman factor-like [Malus sylvestris]